MNRGKTRAFDIVGVGLGPSNLSLAALIADQSKLGDSRSAAVFLERDSTWHWHDNLAFDGTRLQNSLIRDLVTPVDPTSEFSYLNFLKHHGRLLQFLNTGEWRPQRSEFNQYCKWVAENTGIVEWSRNVSHVDWDHENECFAVSVGRSERPAETLLAQNLAIGTGLSELVPESLRDVRMSSGNRVLLASEIAGERELVASAKVAVVIGSGQTGGEVLEHLLSTGNQLESVIWVTRRSHIRSLETGPFAIDSFSAAGHARHRNEDIERRRKLAFDMDSLESGLSIETSKSVYRKIYELRHLRGRELQFVVSTNTTVSLPESRNIDGVTGQLVELQNESTSKTLEADIVVIACGFEEPRLALLAPLESLGLSVEPPFELDPDFSLPWRGRSGSPANKIYLHGYGRQAFGVTEPNLTMAAVRSATIVNSFFDRPVYSIDSSDAISLDLNAFNPL